MSVSIINNGNKFLLFFGCRLKQHLSCSSWYYSLRILCLWAIDMEKNGRFRKVFPQIFFGLEPIFSDQDDSWISCSILWLCQIAFSFQVFKFNLWTLIRNCLKSRSLSTNVSFFHFNYKTSILRSSNSYFHKLLHPNWSSLKDRFCDTTSTVTLAPNLH